MFSQDKRGDQRRLLGIGDNGIYADAWGKQKTVNDFSIFHGMFTFDIPDKMWLEYFNGVEQPKTNCTTLNGMLKIVSNGGSTYLMSRRHPRYQPNRGMLYSNSFIFDNATLSNGKLYAVIRTTYNGTTYEDEKEVKFDAKTFGAYNPAKGNIYDIQAQWRGVGNIKFFVNQQEVVTFDYLGELDELSIANPALPLGFECDNQGSIKFGSFAPMFGMFFEWRFNTPQETQARCGCVDLTSEAGTDETQFFVSIVGEEITVSDGVVLAIRIPDMFNGSMNTRDVQLAIIKAATDKKSKVEIYTTRDATALTLNGISWQSENGGNIEALKPTISTQVSFDKNKAVLLDLLPCLPDVNNQARNPDPQLIDFFLIHGDYLILNGVGSVTTFQAIIQAGEEL